MLSFTLSLFLPVLPEDSFIFCCLKQGVLHNGLGPVTLIQAEVYVSRGAGVADHLAGAHHALLSHPEGRQPPLPGFIRRGVGRGAQDPRLHSPCLHGEQ